MDSKVGGNFTPNEQIGLTAVGKWNEMPKPYEEINQERYIGLALHQAMRGIGIRQVYDLFGDKRHSKVRVEFYGDYALAMAYPEYGQDPETNEWGYFGQIRYFRVGCTHKDEHVSNDGRCLNTYKCKLCGRTKQIDSSD